MPPERRIPDDARWMRRAIELSVLGAPGVSPNPLVGCVIVKNQKLVGEGFHEYFGGPHAEIRALKKAGSRARGATLYVNLEPCSHFGKTPPCTDALIRAGVKKVVAAMPDPNPIVSGRGFKKLKAAGIPVETGVLRAEAEDLNRAFIKFITKKKPYVILKAAVSLDGKIASASGDSKWISSEASRDLVHSLRTEVDGILVGGETVRKDDPSLTSHGKGRNPVRIILSRSGRLPRNAKVFDGKAPCWVFRNIRWESFLKTLAEKGISKLLIEGGGNTAAGALEAGVVDEVLFFIAPILIGGKDAPTAFEGKGFSSVKKALKLEDCFAERIGGDIVVNARIK